MTYSIITPADNADFFAQFKTFVVSAGWTIDAQSESELYIHSGDKYLGFRLGNITYNTSSNGVFFTCAINTAYDSTKSWFEQPGSSISNLNAAYLPIQGGISYTKYVSCMYCPGDITTAVFAADLNNIIIKIKRGALVNDVIVVTLISKAHTFEGGDIIASRSHLLKTDASSSWIFNPINNTYNYGRLFSSLHNAAGTTGLGSLTFSALGSFATVFSTLDFFLTNITSDYSVAIAATKVPFAPATILSSVSPSSYTGLYALISPEFFYLNAGAYCYAGKIEKIKIINGADLVDQQILNYGDKSYLILSVIDGNIMFPATVYSPKNPNRIAIEL
jgi:hypothetical protein